MGNKAAIFLSIVLLVIVSGCIEPEINEEIKKGEAVLLGSVNDKTISSDSPGEITLNARNMENQSASFFVTVEPVGDYKRLVKITDRQGQQKNNIQLGEAVEGATTGEKFAVVRKKLNVTADVKVRAELYRSGDDEKLDSDTYQLRMREN